MRWLADQNLDNAIVRGLLRRNVAFDIVHARDVGLSRASDADLLAWAAQEDRILLTHDVSTVPPAAYERVKAAKPMPGVFAIPEQAAIGAVSRLHRALPFVRLNGFGDSSKNTEQKRPSADRGIRQSH